MHRLPGIDAARSGRLRAAILAGDEMAKPGFTRLNLSVRMTAAKVAFILDSVADLARRAPAPAADYRCDPARAIFAPRAREPRARPPVGSDRTQPKDAP